jgi:predicted cupin superfamily sugar epimerase
VNPVKIYHKVLSSVQKRCNVNPNSEAELLIRKLKLEPHKEGGYFKVTYESESFISLVGYDGQRHISTAIYYLLVGDQISAFHRIKSDEIWHHYLGSSLDVFLICEDDALVKIKLGKNFHDNEVSQLVIMKETWLAASLTDRNSFALIGATVSPGFDWRDWELGQKEYLSRLYPQHKNLVERYSKN